MGPTNPQSNWCDWRITGGGATLPVRPSWWGTEWLVRNYSDAQLGRKQVGTTNFWTLLHSLPPELLCSAAAIYNLAIPDVVAGTSIVSLHWFQWGRSLPWYHYCSSSPGSGTWSWYKDDRWAIRCRDACFQSYRPRASVSCHSRIWVSCRLFLGYVPPFSTCLVVLKL